MTDSSSLENDLKFIESKKCGIIFKKPMQIL